LLDCLRAALDEVDARRCVARSLGRQPLRGEWHVMAIGKAAAAMTLGAHDALGPRMPDALVVTKADHVPDELRNVPGVEIIESAHPLPDERSLHAGAVAVDRLHRSPRASRWLFLVSGGASGLVEHLVPGVGLDQLRRFNAWALGAGLDITAINRLRQRLSLIKGGGLARSLGRRRGLALMISDVPGDDPRLIGSGLLHASPVRSAARDASLIAALPSDLVPLFAGKRRKKLRRDAGRLPVRIIASNGAACRAAARRGRALGYTVSLHRARFAGDARALARRFTRTLLRSSPDSMHVWGGESTVRLPANPGRGGRNQQLALQAAVELAGRDDVALLAAGTDGIDGVTDDAGAIVDGETAVCGTDQELDAAASLAAADAGWFLERCGALVHTGPTLTNVGDLVLAIRSRESR